MSCSSPSPKPEPATRRQWIQGLAAAGVWGAWVGPLTARATGQAAEPAVAGAPLAVQGLQLQPRGVGQLRFLGLEIYTARLWVAEGFDPERHAQRPLALELAYRRGFSARQIAERSLQEMKRQTQISPAQEAQWIQDLTRILPDVKPGDRLLGVHRPQQGAMFLAGTQPGARVWGGVDDPVFSALFFGIWLSPATSEPALRLALVQAG